jgi:hypothetical protein
MDSCIDPKSVVVVLDAGHFLVESQLADKAVLAEISAQKKGTGFDEADMSRLTGLLYDRFTIEMSSVQVCLILTIGSCWEFCFYLHGKT